MSIHSSLKSSSLMTGERSVFTRVERLAILKKAGKFDDSGAMSPCGLPKVRTRFKTVGAKKKEAAPAAAAAGAAGGATAAAKPGDKKAAPAKK